MFNSKKQLLEKLDKEDYLLSESPEINIGQRLGWTKRFFNVFPALENKNYRLFFIGQAVSFIGSWLQMVAQGWLVWDLTKSALALGVIGAIGSLPIMLFSLWGGVIVDRFSKRKILILTQFAMMLLAFVLGLLAIYHLVNVWLIGILAFLLGIINALDAPARQAFMIEMVNEESDLPSAIALTAGIFNGARVIGPSIAGFLIATVGVGWAFLANGISFAAVIIALLLMKIKEISNEIHPHPLKAIKEGISYTLKHPVIKTLLIFTGVVSVFGWSYATILPLIAQNIFHSGAAGLGYLYTAAGVGAFLGVIIVSAFSKKLGHLIFIFGGNVIFTIGIILFTFTTNFIFALFFLALAGAGLVSQFSMINAAIQKSVVQKYRGRVMSLYTLMFLGLSPIGSFQVGFLTEHFGPAFAIRMGAVISFFFAIIIFRNQKKSASV